MILPIFHLSVVLINSFTLWYDQTFLDLPELDKELAALAREVPFKCRILFLTIWCMVLQTVYFAVAFINDLVGTNARTATPSFIRTLRDTLFSLAFPVAMFVFIAFWGIYAYNKELIYSEGIEKLLPTWMNHTMHTFIAPFILTELLLTPRNYPSRIVGLSLGVTFVLSYISLLITCIFKANYSVYPILEVLSLEGKIAIITAFSFFGIGIYFMGEKLNDLIHPSPKKNIKFKSR